MFFAKKKNIKKTLQFCFHYIISCPATAILAAWITKLRNDTDSSMFLLSLLFSPFLISVLVHISLCSIYRYILYITCIINGSKLLTRILLDPSSSISRLTRWSTFSIFVSLLWIRNNRLKFTRVSRFSIFDNRLNDRSKTLKM